MGILIHATAGYVDPVFCGQITLEISNVSQIPVALYPAMSVCQLSFELLFDNCNIPYGNKGKYQWQDGPKGSEIYKDFLKE
jgi:dCTP deaminase